MCLDSQKGSPFLFNSKLVFVLRGRTFCSLTSCHWGIRGFRIGLVPQEEDAFTRVQTNSCVWCVPLWTEYLFMSCVDHFHLFLVYILHNIPLLTFQLRCILVATIFKNFKRVNNSLCSEHKFKTACNFFFKLMRNIFLIFFFDD